VDLYCVIEKRSGGKVQGRFQRIQHWAELLPYEEQLVFSTEWKTRVGPDKRQNHIEVWGLFVEEQLQGIISLGVETHRGEVELVFVEYCERIGYPSKSDYLNLGVYLFSLVCYLAYNRYEEDGLVGFESKPKQPLRDYYRNIVKASQSMHTNEFRIEPEHASQLRSFIFEEPCQ
jgi:hypothetical protein